MHSHDASSFVDATIVSEELAKRSIFHGVQCRLRDTDLYILVQKGVDFVSVLYELLHWGVSEGRWKGEEKDLFFISLASNNSLDPVG